MGPRTSLLSIWNPYVIAQYRSLNGIPYVRSANAVWPKCIAVRRANKMSDSVQKRFNAQVNPGTCLLLYVDDDSVNQLVLTTFLSSKPEYRILPAEDKEDVEEWLDEEPHLPDMVLMDNQLANCTGGELMAWMRERYSIDLVFVLCTGRSRAEAAALAEAAKAKAFLCKPYTMKELGQVLSRLNLP